jgi:hypothetical protein
VRFTVTALGSAGNKPVGVVVGQVARYLIAPDQQPAPATGGPHAPGRTGEESVSRYYADRGDAPGRWLGHGARELDLPATVVLDAFTNVLAGRDPRTGARLITARGSAGRVASVGAGTVALWTTNGEALYAVADVAAVLGWSQADVRDAIAAGEHLAASRLVAALAGMPVPAGSGRPGTTTGRPKTTTGQPGPRAGTAGSSADRPRRAATTPGSTPDTPGPETGTPDGGQPADRDGQTHPGGNAVGRRDDWDGDGIVLVPFVDRDGTRYVSDRELSRVEDLATLGVSANDVLGAGGAGDEMSAGAAARLLGVSRSYLARLCRTYVTHEDEISATLAAGETPSRAYVACRRTEDGTYRITRTDLAAFADRRRRPAVRVGYDVTAILSSSGRYTLRT